MKEDSEIMDNTIPVTVDKSHIVSIGERLYSESIELIRELVANSYDADATRVDIFIGEDEIKISDDGEGMNLEGLRQFFNIGSPYKKFHRRTPKFHRERIGEFGIGKFAVLSCASYFEVLTRKGDFCGKVIFDKDRWEALADWQLPLQLLPLSQRPYDGTTIILRKINKKFAIDKVEERLKETLPLRAENFAVYLNNRRITPRISLGHKIPFLEGTSFGPVYGEIVIVSSAYADIKKAGIEIRVKGMLVKKDFFGLENFVKDLARIQGEVNTDFLILTTDRTNIIKNNHQYEEFIKVMKKVIERAKGVIKDVFEFKESRRAKRVLNEVLEKVKRALVLNPQICPEGLVPIGEEAKTSVGESAYVPEQDKKNRTKESSTQSTTEKKKTKKRKQPKLRKLSPTAVVRRLKVGEKGISCCIDHFGEESPESFCEGTVVYINRDHPLFKECTKDKNTFTFYIARLLSQEIALMKTRSAKEAFKIQARILKDALSKKG